MVYSQTDSAGNTTTYNYAGLDPSSGNGYTIETDPDGNETNYGFEGGILVSREAGYGGSSPSLTTYEPDSTTLLNDAVVDPNGNTTSYGYDSNGNVNSMTNPLGNTWTYTYNSFDQKTCAALPLAASGCSSLSPPSPITAGTSTISPPSSAPPKFVTYSLYDTNGDPIWTTTGDYAPGGSTASQSRTTYSLYSGESVTLSGTTDSCAASPPANSLPCLTIDPDKVVTQLGYNSDGDLTSSSTPDGNPGGETAQTTYGYNSDGELTSTTAPDGNLSVSTPARRPERAQLLLRDEAPRARRTLQSQTVGVGSNRYLYVAVTLNSASTGNVTSVTYGGTSMTLVSDVVDDDTVTGKNRELTIWGLTAPTVGPANVVATRASSFSADSGVSVPHITVSQSSPTGTVQSTTGGSSGAPSLSTTTGGSSSDLNLSAVGWRDDLRDSHPGPKPNPARLRRRRHRLSVLAVTQVSAQGGFAQRPTPGRWTDPAGRGGRSHRPHPLRLRLFPARDPDPRLLLRHRLCIQCHLVTDRLPRPEQIPLYVAVTLNSGATGNVTSVTYGGTTMTLLDDVVDQDTSDGKNRELTIWGLTAPAVGTANIVATLASSFSAVSGVSVSLVDVNQAAPIGAIQSATGGSSGTQSLSTTTSGSSSDLNLSALGWRDNTGTASLGTNQTQIDYGEGGSGSAFAVTQVSAQNGGSSITDSWSWTDPADAAVEISIPIHSAQAPISNDYTTTNTYNSDGQLTNATVSHNDGLLSARSTSYGYDGDGNQTSMTDARSKTTNYSFDANDELTLVTDPDSQKTLTCYDGDGNIEETVPARRSGRPKLTSPLRRAPGAGDYPARPTATGSHRRDHLHLRRARRQDHDYHAGTRWLRPSPPAPRPQPTPTTQPASFCERRRTPPASTSGGAPNQDTNYTYDAAGELLTVTKEGSDNSAKSVTSYCYDPDGNKTAAVPPDGNTSSVATCATSSPYQTSSSYQTAYEYDSLGELVSKTTPTTSFVTSPTWAYTYDPAGNLLTSEDPNAVTTTNTYTPLDQLATVSYSSASANPVSYSYDANGNRVSMTDGSGLSSYTYDPFNELTSYENGAGNTVSYAYDADGNTTDITYPLGTTTWAGLNNVSYAYDNADELNSLTDFNGNTISIDNTADGLPYSETLGSTGDTIDSTYDPTDTASDIKLTNGSTLQEFSYSDEPSAAIASETDTPSSSLSPADYTYDAQNRVTQDTPGSGSANNYAFDASGNLTTLPTGASTSYDHASELTSSTLSGTTTNYTYDSDGQRTQETVSGTTTVSADYNGAQQLTSYDNSSANIQATCYDGDGLRQTLSTSNTSCTSPTNTFTWDVSGTLPRLLTDSTNAYIYGPSNTPIEQVNLTSGTMTYLTSDLLGSVRGTINTSGTLTASTSYDAWGNPQTTGGLTSSTPFGYAGGYTDPTGLIYLIGRYYDPQTGQFLTVDPAGDIVGLNAYVYTRDDPVNLTDPSGALALFPFGGSTGASVVATASGELCPDGGNQSQRSLQAVNASRNPTLFEADVPVTFYEYQLVQGADGEYELDVYPISGATAYVRIQTRGYKVDTLVRVISTDIIVRTVSGVVTFTGFRTTQSSNLSSGILPLYDNQVTSTTELPSNHDSTYSINVNLLVAGVEPGLFSNLFVGLYSVPQKLRCGPVKA